VAASDARPAPGVTPGGSNIGLAGRSFAQVRVQEVEASFREDATARVRNESGVKGDFVCFDRRKNICPLAGGRASGVAAVGATELRGLRQEQGNASGRKRKHEVSSERSTGGGGSTGSDAPPESSSGLENMRAARLARFGAQL